MKAPSLPAWCRSWEHPPFIHPRLGRRSASGLGRQGRRGEEVVDVVGHLEVGEREGGGGGNSLSK